MLSALRHAEASSTGALSASGEARTLSVVGWIAAVTEVLFVLGGVALGLVGLLATWTGPRRASSTKGDRPPRRRHWGNGAGVAHACTPTLPRDRPGGGGPGTRRDRRGALRVAVRDAPHRGRLGPRGDALGACRGRRPRLGGRAHRLRGGAAALAATAMAETARALQDVSRGGELAGAGELLDRLELELEHTRAELAPSSAGRLSALRGKLSHATLPDRRRSRAAPVVPLKDNIPTRRFPYPDRRDHRRERARLLLGREGAAVVLRR